MDQVTRGQRRGTIRIEVQESREEEAIVIMAMAMIVVKDEILTGFNIHMILFHIHMYIVIQL